MTRREPLPYTNTLRLDDHDGGRFNEHSTAQEPDELMAEVVEVLKLCAAGFEAHGYAETTGIRLYIADVLGKVMARK